jgi:IclR family transcriptional regulator, acetate operon repressor
MTLQSLDTALELLEYFTRDRPTWGVRELARAADRHHAVVHRILVTLAGRGLLAQNADSGRYSLGVRLFELGVAVRERMHLADMVRPIMQQLVTRSGETLFLCWLQDHEVTCLEVVESASAVKFSTSVGIRSPLHAASFAKVILAFQDESFINDVIAAGLPSLAPSTNTNPEILQTQLAQIRQQRWAYSEQESAPDTCGLAVPIAPRADEVLGSLCIAGPLHRNPGQRLQSLLPELQLGARQVELAMRSFVDSI